MKNYYSIAVIVFAIFFLGGCASTNHSNQGCAYSKKEIATMKQQAEAGDAEIQLLLAKIYNAEICVKKDTRFVQELTLQAAEQGNATAQYNLGSAYDFGLYDFKQDPAQAVYWYRQAAEQGDRQAQFALGRSYYRGTGTDQDLELARTWYQKAADQGHYSAGRALEKLDCEVNPSGCEKQIAQEKKQKLKEKNIVAKRSVMVRKRPETRERRFGWLSVKQRKAAQSNYGVMEITVNVSNSEMENEKASIAKSLATPFAAAGMGTLGGLYVGTCGGYCPTGVGAAVG